EEIVQRKQTEFFLRQSEKKFRQLAENIQEVFWITTLDFKKFIYISPLYENPYEWIDSIAAEDRAMAINTFRGFLEGNQQINIEYKIIRPDGTVRWVQ